MRLQLGCRRKPPLLGGNGAGQHQVVAETACRAVVPGWVTLGRPRCRARPGSPAEAERLVALGATVIRVLSEPLDDHYAIAMTDPEGNEFDIN